MEQSRQQKVRLGRYAQSSSTSLATRAGEQEPTYLRICGHHEFFHATIRLRLSESFQVYLLSASCEGMQSHGWGHMDYQSCTWHHPGPTSDLVATLKQHAMTRCLHHHASTAIVDSSRHGQKASIVFSGHSCQKNWFSEKSNCWMLCDDICSQTRFECAHLVHGASPAEHRVLRGLEPIGGPCIFFGRKRGFPNME